MRRAHAALDHLVVAADNLDQGTAYIRAQLGIAPAGGGRHLTMGTHNRVLKLGARRYLEVIAVDPDGREPDGPRWFNLDSPDLRAQLKIRPRLIAWVARTAAIEAMAAECYDRPTVVRAMQRGALRWRFACTADGSLPEDGVIPHLIQWESASHPAETMQEAGCILEGLDGVHAEPAMVRQTLAAMGLENAITVHPLAERHPPCLSARIRTPFGLALLH